MITSPGDDVKTAKAVAVGAAAVITLAADQTVWRTLSRIIFGYSADPTGGGLTVTVGGTDVLSFPITKGGPGPFGVHIVAGHNAVTITLASGGGGVTGEVYVEYSV